jgi:hypothetical protein
LSYDDYHLPGNHKPFGFAAVEEGVEDVRASSIHLSPPTPYDPTNSTLGITTTVTGGEPRTRGRSVSVGSRRISLSFSRNASPSPQPSPSPDPAHERRLSYDHKRDTQFEAYVARRASQRSSAHDRDSYFDGDDVKRALGDEFGFSAAPSPSETISSGAVHAAQVSRPRVSSIGRQTSYEGLVSVASPGITVLVTTPPEESLQRGHSLNSVPEGHEEHEEEASQRGTRKKAVGESQQVLSDKRSSFGSGSGSGLPSPGRIEHVEGFEDIELENKKRRRDS